MPTEGTGETFGTEAMTDSDAKKELLEFFDTRAVDDSIKLNFRRMDVRYRLAVFLEGN